MIKILVTILSAIGVITYCGILGGTEKTPVEVDEIPELSDKKLVEAWLRDQERSCDWPKLSVTPRNWVGKQVELGGWIKFKFGNPGIAAIHLFDSSESMRMGLYRRGVEISTIGFDAFAEQGDQPADIAKSIDGKCVVVTGRFGPGPSTYTLGTLNGPLQIRIEVEEP